MESVFAGAVSPDELQAAILGTVDLVRTSGVTRVLGDVRGLSGGHSVADLFGMVVYLERLGLPADFREALLVRMFTDRAEAIAWLQSPGR